MDFLTFKRYISIEALMVFYYLGAFLVPVASGYFVVWLRRKVAMANRATRQAWQFLTVSQKMKLVTAFIIMFLLMELFWRMLFEFLIAFIQMRDALVQIGT